MPGVLLLLSLIAVSACHHRESRPAVTGSSAPVVRRVASVGEFVGLSGASISPDGRYLAHTDWTTGDLAVRDLRTGETRRITNNGSLTRSVEFAEFFMQFSRDGRKLAYIWDRNGYELHVTDLEPPGTSRFVYRNPPGQGEVLVYDWSDDGEYLAAVVPRSADDRRLRISLIDASNGSLRGLMDLDGSPSPAIQDLRATRMGFSSDSRFLAYDLPAAGSQNRDIFVRALESDQNVSAVQHPADDRLFDWTPDGTALVFWSNRGASPGMWLQPMQSGKPSGSAERMTDLGDGARPLGFANDGAYCVAVGETRRHEVFVASLDLDQGRLSAVAAAAQQVPGPRSAPDWSADGKSLAYLERSTIVIRSLESGEARKLVPPTLAEIFTVGTGERYLRWSPDGRHLLAPQNRMLMRIDVASGEATPFVGTNQVADRRSRYGRWSPDGKAVFYTRQPAANDGTAEIVRMDLQTENKQVLHRATLPGDHYSSLELSPDGRWLAFSGVAAAQPPESEATTLDVISSGGPARRLLQISGREWIKVVGWAPDSQQILFTRGDKLAGEVSTTLWRISVRGGEPRGIEVGVPVLHAVRFHPDGKRVAFDAGRRGAEILRLEGLLTRR